MLRRPWSEQQTGVLVSPWMLFGKDARIITLFGDINSSVSLPLTTLESVPFLAEDAFASLIYLAEESSDPVKIVINNRGGHVPAGLTIIQGIEHLQKIGIEVEILVLGAAMSMASVILATGTEGKRFAFERSVIHLHSGHQKSEGTPEEKERLDKYLGRITNDLREILAKRTKIPEFFVGHNDTVNPELLESEEGRIKLIKEFLGQEQFLTPQQAVEAGIIDKMLRPGDKEVTDIFSLKTKGGAR